MQRFDRKLIPTPEVLKSTSAQIYRKKFIDYYLSKNEKRAQTRVPEVGSWLNSAEIKNSLTALFHKKCAFCEQATDLNIVHFRPRSEATPSESAQTSHLYYSWLAGAWENLYLSCSTCNKAKGSQFPVDGLRVSLPTNAIVKKYVLNDDGEWPDYPIREKNLLLDPCYDGSFYLHFQAKISGIIVGLSEKGRATIEIFQLNRQNLIDARAKKIAYYSQFFGLNSREAEMGKGNDWLDIFNFQELEFGGFWYLLLRDFAERYLDEISAKNLQPNFIGKILRRLDRSIFKRLLFDDQPVPVAHAMREFRVDTISSIQIKNFKALENIALTLPDLQPGSFYQHPSLLILGENSAGKSSILEAIALTLCQPSERDALNLASRDLMLSEEFLGGATDVRRPATVTVSFVDGRKIVFKAQKRGMFGDTPEHKLPVFGYGAFRQYLNSGGSDSPARSIISLFKSDEILANPEGWLLRLAKDSFDRVVRALRDIFSVDGSFDIIKREPKKKRCVIINGAGRNSGKTPLSLASSGFRSLLGMLCEVMEGLLQAGVSSGSESFDSIRAVVLIDEIEAHLHPRWKMQIMRGLRRALPSVTFIATTHDPLCLRGMEKGEAVVIRRVRKVHTREGSVAEHVEVLTELPDLTQLSIEQLLTSDFFGLVSTESEEIEQQLGNYAELVGAARNGVLGDTETQQLKVLQRDIADALPIGNNAAQQLIEEALLDYLKGRRTASAATLNELNNAAKLSIVKVLEGI
ncbi:DNA replication and repair protein RecF [compost metagenome]